MAPEMRIRLANEISLVDIIEKWAARYDLPPSARRVIVNRTIDAAIVDQRLLYDDPEYSLNALLDRFASEHLTNLQG